MTQADAIPDHVFAFIRDRDLESTLKHGIGDQNDFFPVFADHDRAETAASSILGTGHAIVRIDLKAEGSPVTLDPDAAKNSMDFITEVQGYLTYCVGKVDADRLEVSEGPSPSPGI